MGQSSFAEYQRETSEWIRRNRSYQTKNIDAETAWNAPHEWRPDGKATKGILLVHGLGDSPWQFTDLGPEFAARGFLARAVLLSGHGTKPADMIEADIADWRRVVSEQTRLLQQEVGDVYLGGFSTGANLVLEYALDHPEIKGLVLVSPAFKSDEPFDFLTPLVNHFTDWIFTPRSDRPLETPIRYVAVPTNGFAQYYKSSAAVLTRLRAAEYDKPVFVAAASHDATVDTRYVLDIFGSVFTNPASRMIWYGEIPPGVQPSGRVLAWAEKIPEWRVSHFSHVCLLFRPDNPVNGIGGSERLCWSEYRGGPLLACPIGGEIWYSEWGYREPPDKTHARLLFNPYFERQAEVMFDVLADRRKMSYPSGPPEMPFNGQKHGAVRQ